MTQNKRDLLLKDLCARLPYKVKLSYRCNHNHILKGIHESGLIVINDVSTNTIITTDVENTQPYLFPLSSMTDEQNKEYLKTCKGNNALFPTLATFEWCIKNYFDYRGLISMGLAIDATDLNIY